MKFGLQVLLNKWFIVEEVFRSEIKMFCDRLPTSQTIDVTLNIEKCKFSENCAKEERCLSEVQIRSRPLFIDTEWPRSHCPKLQRHKNIKDVLRTPFFWVSESLCFEDGDLGEAVLVLLFPLQFSWTSQSVLEKDAGVQHVLCVQ